MVYQKSMHGDHNGMVSMAKKTYEIPLLLNECSLLNQNSNFRLVGKLAGYSARLPAKLSQSKVTLQPSKLFQLRPSLADEPT